MTKVILTFGILTYFCIAVAENRNNSSATENNENEVRIENMLLGKTIVLPCGSNDEDHNFQFWQLPQNEGIVGPGNQFDDSKYNYEILSGKLFIKKLSTADAGTYHCVSEGVRNSDVNIRSVRMVVHQEDNSGLNYLKGVVVVACLIILFGLCYLVQSIRKRRRFHELLETHSEEDDESGEELFTAPGTPSGSGNIVIHKFEEKDELVEIDIPRISIDLDDDLISRHNK